MRFFSLAILLAIVFTSSYGQEENMPANSDQETKVAKASSQHSPYPTYELEFPLYASWGINSSPSIPSINLKNAWKTFSLTKEVKVALIDTGIYRKKDTSDGLFHPFIRSNIALPYGEPTELAFGFEFKDGVLFDTEPDDTLGHGTHLAGIIRSVFPDVRLIIYKLSTTEKITDGTLNWQVNMNDVVSAINHAIESRVDIINLAINTTQENDELKAALERAEHAEILIVTSAGNDRKNLSQEKSYPASYALSNMIVVGAYTRDLNIWKDSNYSAQTVHLFAPGDNITSLALYDDSRRLKSKSGTSQATAFVCGAAALIKAKYPELTGSEIKALLITSAKQENSLAPFCSSHGRLDVSKATKLSGQYLDQKKKLKEY